MLASEETALRALGRSGRRLLESGRGDWVVLSGSDRRRRPQGALSRATVDDLAEQGLLKPAPSGGYVLAQSVERPDGVVPAPPLIVEPAGRPRRCSGQGFALLVQQAQAGEGPLSLRQAAAGARLVADAEAAGREPGLTMNWDAMPRDAVRRGGRGGGWSQPAMSAERRIRRVQRRVDPELFALAWAACVDGRSLSALRTTGRVRISAVRTELARALEAIADAYDG